MPEVSTALYVQHQLSVIRSFLTTLTQIGLPFDVDDPLMKRLPGVLLPHKQKYETL